MKMMCFWQQMARLLNQNGWWILLSQKHICRDREMFDTLKTNGEFDHFKIGNGEKMKVEGIGSVRMKLCDNAIRIFSNVRFVLSVVVNMISKGRWHHKGTNMLVQSRDAKRRRGNTWCCDDIKINVTFAIWMVKSWRGTMIAKWRRKWSGRYFHWRGSLFPLKLIEGYFSFGLRGRIVEFQVKR